MVGAFIFSSCHVKNGTGNMASQEDAVAKKMLQGIWVNDDEGNIAFRAAGDTIYYPDSTSQPVRFKIVNDTLFLEGSNIVKYPIVKQAAHLFIFKNQNGDQVKLIKSSDPADKYAFGTKQSLVFNQNKLIKRDTVVVYRNEKYHGYVQVNPTSYKVFVTSYNDEGVEVDNVYYDNIIHLSIFNGSKKLFSRDFHKNDFSHNVPDEFIRQSVLSDLVWNGISVDGIHYLATLGIPDSETSYQVQVIISFDGNFKMSVKK